MNSTIVILQSNPMAVTAIVSFAVVVITRRVWPGLLVGLISMIILVSANGHLRDATLPIAGMAAATMTAYAWRQRTVQAR